MFAVGGGGGAHLLLFDAMRFGPALLALVGVAPGGGARADSPRYELRVELGGEYDSNPGRIEEVEGRPASPPIQGSPLGRFVLAGDAAGTLAGRHALSLSLGLAGKAFTRSAARDENVLVGQASAGWSVLLGGRTSLGVTGSYYDVGQRRSLEARDFRSLTPALRLDQGLGAAGQLSIGGGYRWFTYKPEPDFDFAGPSAFVQYRQLAPAEQPGGADWEWSAGLSAEARGFAGVRCTGIDSCPGPPTAGQRRDQFLVAHLEATRTGTFLAGAGLAADGNASNSYGEAVIRGLVHLRAVFSLPGDLLLSARAELVAARYRDAVPLARAVVPGTPQTTIEDERRSTLRLEAVRPLSPHVDLGARYTFHTNEIAAGPVRFRRQTFLLFVAFSGGS
jgi:hypothetical protein